MQWESDLFTMSMITDWFRLNKVILQTNHRNYNFWEKKNSKVMKEDRRGKFALKDSQRKHKLFNITPKSRLYTCQLFLKYRREIFILGVLGFLKTTRSFPTIPEEVRSFPEKSEVFRRCPSGTQAETALTFPSPSLRTRINASLLPVLF